MTNSRRVIAAVAAAAVMPAFAGEQSRGDASPAPPPPGWEFALTVYPTIVRGGENYTSAIAAADRGPLHFEARDNYEAIGARSAFVGWNFAGGDTVTWELTPLAGGAWGATHGFIPGLEASLGRRQFDFYIEAEYVRGTGDRSDGSLYAWSELAFRPAERLRIGLAGQRTRIYGGERDLQRAPFAQVTWGPATIGGYWFSPGSSEQVFVGMISASF